MFYLLSKPDPPSVLHEEPSLEEGLGTRLCSAGMQLELAGWYNQISNNALLNYLLQSKQASWVVYQSVFTAPAVADKMSWLSFAIFKTAIATQIVM